MNKLFLTMLLALVTTIASAQFSVITTMNEVEDTTGETTYNLTDKLGVLYQVNEKLAVGITMDGEDNYELVGRYTVHETGVWATCIYNYMPDSEEELKDKLDLGLGYSFNIWKKLSVDPYYVMPIKEDEEGNREGKFNLGLSYKF